MRRMRKVYFVVAVAISFLIAASVGVYVWQNNVFAPPVEFPEVATPALPPDVKTLSDTNLEDELITGMKALVSNYEVALGLRTAEYFREFVARGLSSAQVDSLNQSLVEKNGPCWAAREGECRE